MQLAFRALADALLTRSHSNADGRVMKGTGPAGNVRIVNPKSRLDGDRIYLR